jgi:hypothetical protein
VPRAFRPSSRTAALLPAVLLAACGGDGSDPGAAKSERSRPEATVARWVAEGDCSLYTDRHVAQGYGSVAEGRRACQAEADKTPVERYRVQTTRVDGNGAMVVLAVEGGARYTFWLVASGERDWKIDGYEERGAGEALLGSLDVIETFERRTGERLDRLPEVSSIYHQTLGFPEFFEAADVRPEDLSERSEELFERFGVFSIFVAYSVAEAKRLAEGEGIEKRYRNVVLVWTPGEDGRTDHRFDLLDSILSRVGTTR